ncbi:hypothetical protein GYMLUDRAFT_568043 [Collybiopsis luxurians FD-317 M1]|uniref:Pre-SET domain-containing protein n=1 Tax=Collybiopsis luxurians FD-317 M1 TaxID=944289 RepID=A0A0D0BD56_9AGAR|nr:hypothetical protein GYMLUDRAFT_568043 [Collybiopsis luxurians FD-317 M1]
MKLKNPPSVSPLSSSSKPYSKSKPTVSSQSPGLSSSHGPNHGEKDSSDSDSKEEKDKRSKKLSELMSFLKSPEEGAKDGEKNEINMRTEAVSVDENAQEDQQKVEEVITRVQAVKQKQPVHPTQIQELNRFLEAMEMESSNSKKSGQGVNVEAIERDGRVPATEDNPMVLPPLDYVDIDLDSPAEEDKEPADEEHTMQVDAKAVSAAEVESDTAPADHDSQGDDENDAYALQLNNAYARQLGNDSSYEESAGSDSGPDSEKHVQDMLAADTDPESPISPVTTSEPMVQVPVTELEIAGRSISSRSPSSEDNPDVALRRSSRARRPSRRPSSRYTSSSAESFAYSSASASTNATPPRSSTPEDHVDEKKSIPLSLGGFPVVTWAQRREWLRYQPPPHRFSKDIKHELHDYINSYHPEMRHYDKMTHVYEAMIFENTCRDEPHAPPIRILNEVDDEESTPPWEFLYTNEMWLGEGVEPPSRVKLEGCDCEGKCTKKTCKCWKKQEQHTLSYEIQGFMYDQNGLLKASGHPVFECNSLCNCGEECKNRVVGEGRKCKVMIKKTKDKGWGVFACERIPRGTFIGIYSGELLGHEESEKRGIKYDEFGRTYLFDIDWWYMPNNQEAAAENGKARAMDHTSIASAINEAGNNNSDSDSDSDEETRKPAKYTIDAYHAGNVCVAIPTCCGY